ncbi:MAG: cation-transporting P-type ATPase [Clostridia bacterium]|nr:cation-transporting P-type ATPase [Clostridia bacterium]
MNRDRNWHSRTTAQLERIFRTDSARGLSDKEALRRLRHGKNTVWEVKTASVKGYTIRSFFDLCTLLLVLAVFAAAAFGSAEMAAAICLMLIVGRVARIAAHIWAERVFETNARESLPRAKVVRDSNVKVVASDMIAPGDVIILDSGDTVPCDIRLTAADNVLVAEGNVTGSEGIVSKNSEIINVREGEEVPITVRTNTMYASSVVISGLAIGIAVATGDDTLICTREGRIRLSGEKDVSTVEKLSDWGRICSLCLIAAALVITVIGITVGKGTLADTFLPSIAMAAAGLSEFIAAIGAFAWALKLRSEEGCVLSRSSIAEKAANTEIMALRSVNVMRSGKITLHSHYSDSKLTMMGTKDAKAPARLLRLACYCTGASPEGGIVRGNFGTRHRNAGALPYRLVRSLWDDNATKAEQGDVYNIVQHMPAGDIDAQGLDNVLLVQGNDYYFCAMGSVSRILSLSSHYRKNNEAVPMTEAERSKIVAFAGELQRHGVSLCAIGFRGSHYTNLRRLSVLHSNLCFEGFIAVADRPEPGVVDAINDLRSVGAGIVIFSENGEEDKCYAKAEGIFKTGDTFLPVSESIGVRSLNVERGSLVLVETPSGSDGVKERLRFMKLLKKSERSVSYVGYGIEDMWNMKCSDAAFAVGGEGGSIPQGTRTAAHGIACSEGGGFDAVCKLVNKCRCALINIRNILNYLIASQVARLVLMLVSAAAGLVLPGAASLVLWGVLLDFSVAFAMATVPGEASDTMLRSGRVSATPDSPREVLLPTMYGAVTAAFSVAVPFLARALAQYGGFAADINAAALMTCSVVSCIIAMPFVGAEYAGGYGLFSKKSRLSVWFAIPFAVVAVSVLVMLMPGTGSAFGATFPGWIMSAFTLAPAALIVTVMSIVRAMNKK